VRNGTRPVPQKFNARLEKFGRRALTRTSILHRGRGERPSQGNSDILLGKLLQEVLLRKFPLYHGHIP
jgi:hypothetical protein